ncbi:aspartate--tRNA(Asn) ligase [Actinospica sp. MGRD01-02]|uniref:Aspartate--tRNA(Asp/Asn) ligase n=1 Tax=Actinospica acidithermotolerans TaxID=2828514 RepID=A0A941EGN6_9ACTN|nr:aspartate--tRNA(Asn) ligase [Actinospica acidithermotolerans]MBR7827299.1 aspartate--tRNA(Asn) ligase [Actinospica acidithermotolerans]
MISIPSTGSAERVLISELPACADRPVSVEGWLHRRRTLKTVTFLVLRDRTGLVQAVLREPHASALEHLTEESVLRVSGIVKANRQAPGGIELIEPHVAVLSGSTEPAPFDLYRPTVPATLPTILDHSPVTLRHPRLRAPHVIAAASVAGYRAALDGLGFTEIHTPKIVGSSTESGANVFEVDYFGTRAYLAQSPQFFKQMMVGVFERVYETGPVFRAEPSDTARHLAQYTSLDAELGFIDDHRDVMEVLREAVDGMLSAVRERAQEECELLGARLPEVPARIPEIHFAQAQELLAAHTAQDPRGEPDLAPAHERWLCEWAAREHGSEFLFVTGYPMRKRPFYTHAEPGRPEYSNSFDLLFRGLEIVTGGQRLHKYEDYVAALAERGEGVEAYEGYLQAFRRGMPPHGGFAMGLERWVARLVGAENVRLATLFPRDITRLSP